MAQDSNNRLSPKSANSASNIPKRPAFNSSITADRLRECERRPSVTSVKNQKKGPGRKSAFIEIGLEDDEIANETGLSTVPKASNRPSSPQEAPDSETKENDDPNRDEGQKAWYSRLTRSRPAIKTSASAPPGSFSSIPRVALIVFLIAVVVPGFRLRGGVDNVPGDGADAGIIRRENPDSNMMSVLPRADSPISICTRWSHQSEYILRCMGRIC